MYLNTDAIYADALPVSPEGAAGMAESVKRLTESYREHGYDANGSPVPEMEVSYNGLDLHNSASPSNEPAILGWAVFITRIEQAAIYNLEQREQAFEAAKRWGGSIIALCQHPGCPDVTRDGSYDANGSPANEQLSRGPARRRHRCRG